RVARTVRRNAAVRARDIPQRRYQQRCRTHEQEGQRELRDDDTAIEKTSPHAYVSAPTSLERRREIRSRRANGRHETEQRHARNGHGGGERKQYRLEVPTHDV